MSSTTSRPTLMIVGGFLGAGKTTTILALARALEAAGRTFGIVTNDQGSDLVDTHFLRSHDLVVNEVTGGCFCCNFDQFAGALAAYGPEVDVILAEPVGSCTDLVATLFRPLRSEQTRRFELAPLAVVVDPRRARKYIRGAGSPEINYLFGKQAEEADLLLLNKTDTLDRREVDELREELGRRFPGRSVAPVSATTGEGIAEIIELLGKVSHRDAPLEISYDRYGESEAALGWLNLRARIDDASALDPNELAVDVLRRIGAACRERSWEIAHAKIYLVGGLDHTKASLVDETAAPTVDDAIASRPESLSLVLNARVAAPPADLEREATTAIREALSGPRLTVESSSAFAPAYPTPTHRIDA